MLLAKLFFTFEHVIIEVHAPGEVLSDNVVVGFGFEEIDDPDDFWDVTCLLKSQNFRLVLEK